MSSVNLNTYLRENSVALLNDSIPAAPDGATNVTWQEDTFGNISASVTASGGGTSVGTAGQLQMVGETEGSFAASSITDSGTAVTVGEPVTINSSSTSALTLSSSATLGTGIVIGGTATGVHTNLITSNNFGELEISDITNSIECLQLKVNNDTTGQLTVPGGTVIGWRPGALIRGAGGTVGFSTDADNVLKLGNGSFDNTGATLVLGTIQLTAATTATSATAGAATALPATPTGYVEIPINGTTMKIPYYTV